MAAMDPKPGKLQENVILKFKNLKVTKKQSQITPNPFSSVSVSFTLWSGSVERGTTLIYFFSDRH